VTLPGNIWVVGTLNDWNPVRINYQNGITSEQSIDIPSLVPDSLFKAGKVAINPVTDKDVLWSWPVIRASIRYMEFSIDQPPVKTDSLSSPQPR